jgi:hypothetical protein
MNPTCRMQFQLRFGRVPLSMTLARILGVLLLGAHGLWVIWDGLWLLMAIPKTLCVCGTTLRGMGWSTAFKWCMLPFGPLPGVMEFPFGAVRL